ncbi:MAG: CpXC domain-containing protein [Treponema sp.]|nr:CpXC domain-containing protein [Treponema sp.]
MKKNINCPCGTNFQIEYDEEVDLDINPGKDGSALDKIFNGTFMSFKCAFCGKNHKPEFRITIIWKSKNLKMNVLPELERGEFYRNKNHVDDIQTIISFPEMADRLSVINDNLEPVVIEALKSLLLAKAAENYPENDVNAWYYSKSLSFIEFHLDGIRLGEVAVMRIPNELYEKTLDDFLKRPKDDFFSSLRVRSYLSVQNVMRPDALK